jgi:hypothetical protein
MPPPRDAIITPLISPSTELFGFHALPLRFIVACHVILSPPVIAAREVGQLRPRERFSYYCGHIARAFRGFHTHAWFR